MCYQYMKQTNKKILSFTGSKIKGKMGGKRKGNKTSERDTLEETGVVKRHQRLAFGDVLLGT